MQAFKLIRRPKQVLLLFEPALGPLLAHLVQLVHAHPLLGVARELLVNEVREFALVYLLPLGFLEEAGDVGVAGQVVLWEHLGLHAEAQLVKQHLLILHFLA